MAEKLENICTICGKATNIDGDYCSYMCMCIGEGFNEPN